MVEGTERQRAMQVLAMHLSSESILTLEQDGRPTPRLAERWEWEDEGRTLRLSLRPDVRFHDGTVVTATAVAEALERYHQPRRNNPRYVGGARNIESIEAVDKSTVAIRLTQPDSFLVTELTQILVDAGNGGGAGPFRLVSSAEAMRLERFESYYRGTPAPRSVSIQPFDSQRSAWAALLRGELDAVQEVQRDAVEFMEGSTQVRTFSLVRPFYIMLAFNLRNEVLRSSEVRRAITEAVNRQGIVHDALRGFARVAENPIWPDHWALSGAARRYTHNPEAARLRLERAGHPLKQSAGEASPGRFSIECIFWNEDPQYERIGLLLQRYLLQVGIDLRLNGQPLDELTSRAGTGAFQLALLPARGGRSLDITYEYWRSPTGGAAPRLNNGYSGADAALDALRAARTDNEFRSGIADLQERFYEDAPAVFIAWPETTRAVSTGIDVSEVSDPDIFSNIWRWRRAAPERSP